MRNEMRFENGSNFVEIAKALSEADGEVWIVESNISFEHLPVKFRARVKSSDEQGFERLKNAVLSWTERNGYEFISDNNV